MLVLSRRLNQKILFPTINTSVQVVSVKPGVIRLGIEAPPEVLVLREEIAGDRKAPAPAAPDRLRLRELNALLEKRLEVLTAGLDVLRSQLTTGQADDAVFTLDEVEDEVRLLRQRLAGEVDRPAPAPKPRRALLVEDNANERELLASFLRSTGIEVATAGDGCDALDYLKSHGQPDVMLLDMGMPRCDGPTTVRAIRRDPHYAGLKIFAVTGRRPEEFDLGAGVDRWFQKPIDPSVLLRDMTSAVK